MKKFVLMTALLSSFNFGATMLAKSPDNVPPDGYEAPFNGKDRVVPLKKADKPIGEWNRFKMMVQNNEVTVWLNDELIVDKAPKKFNRKYPVGLQDHGTVVWFRNIFVKELPEREFSGE